MKWILIVSAVILTAVIAIWLIGRSLPVSHTVTVDRAIDDAPERVWSRIRNVESWPEWRNDVTSVERRSDETIEVVDGNGSVRYSVDEPSERTLITTISSENLPWGGRWIWTVVPEGTGSRVTITEEGEVYNPIFRFLSRYVFGHETSARTALDQLESASLRD